MGTTHKNRKAKPAINAKRSAPARQINITIDDSLKVSDVLPEKVKEGKAFAQKFQL